MADRKLLRLSATLLFVGVALSVVAGLLHPDREMANNHPAVFAEYAASTRWAAVHLGQFAGMAVLIAGLLVLREALALNAREGGPTLTARFAAVAAGVALALYGVLQAVDGVALKQAVDAWARAPEAEKAARFAGAETVRWLEWGVRSYQSFTLGLTLLLFAAVIVWTARTPRAIGILMALSGVSYLAQGWVLGVAGFSAANAAPTLLGIVTIVLWSIWLLVVAWTRKETLLTSPAPSR